MMKQKHFSFWKGAVTCALSAAMLLPVFGAFSAEAVNVSDCVIIDAADLLTDSQEEFLTKNIQETAETIDMNIMIYVSGSHVSRSDTQMYCERLCVDAYGYDDDSVVYYMDLSGHDDPNYSPYDFIYTRNRARFYFTDDSYGGSNRIDSIFYRLDPYLPRCEEDVPGAVTEFLKQLNYYYRIGPDYDYYYYVPDKGKYVTLNAENQQVFRDSAPKNWGMSFLIGLVASLVITLITMFCIRRHYKFKDAASSLHYLDTSKIQITRRSDRFIRTYQTKVKIESSSGGGGGFSGTSSGGGGGGHSR